MNAHRSRQSISKKIGRVARMKLRSARTQRDGLAQTIRRALRKRDALSRRRLRLMSLGSRRRRVRRTEARAPYSRPGSSSARSASTTCPSGRVRQATCRRSGSSRRQIPRISSTVRAALLTRRVADALVEGSQLEPRGVVIGRQAHSHLCMMRGDAEAALERARRARALRSDRKDCLI